MGTPAASSGRDVGVGLGEGRRLVECGARHVPPGVTFSWAYE
jgi:hypothetical protein